MSRRRIAICASYLLVSTLILSACQGLVVSPTPTATTLPTLTTSLPPTQTAVPQRSLSICLGQEPASLFPINNTSSAAQAVLAAVYEGPIDTNSYQFQPVILKDLPSVQNGDAQIFKQSSYIGDEVVDANGLPVTLAVGTKVRPSGCRDNSCAITYDGKGNIDMDAVQVTFRLLPGLTWSDGEPLTSHDSVFAYNLASNPGIEGAKYLADRTKSYEATDDTTVQWWGKPGFIDSTYLSNFFTPLPEHLWKTIPITQLASTPEASQSPVGWGPYAIQEWVPGDHITLTRNPHYFRASQGLPKFTSLTFHFTPDPAAAINDLINHTCDILDPSINLDGQVDLLRTMSAQKQAQALISTGPVMEQLAFGIRPASYDNGYAAGVDRPDYFGDPHIRQAVAMCIDRQKIASTVLEGLTQVPDSFVPADDPQFNTTVNRYDYDVSAANALLKQAGWLDVNNNLATPRQAWGVKNVPDGTLLQLNYITTSAPQRVQVSSMIADSLAQCGIKVNIKYLDQSVFYAAGPDGPLFGRSFDLAEFAMGSTGTEPPCDWFTSSQIPNTTNFWIGTNISGYSSPEFDQVCTTVQQTLIDQPEHNQAYRQAQSIFSEDLPVIPLYWRVKVAAARPDMCNFSLDPTSSSSLWNIARFDYGEPCN